MVRKRIGKVFRPKIVAALLAAVISVSNVQSVNAVVNDNADSTSTEGSASEDKILDGETAWVDGKQVTGNIETLNPDPLHSDLTDGKSGENGVPSTGFNYEISSVGKNGQTIMIPKHMYTGKDDGNTFNIYIPSIKDLIANSDPTDTYMQEKTVKVSEEGLEITPDNGFVGITKLTIDPEDQLKKENIRDGVKIFGVTGNIKDLTGGDVNSKATTADEKAANGFDYTVSSIGTDGQTITIPKAKYSGDDDFTVYIPSVLDLVQNNPDPTNPIVPLQGRTLLTSDIKAMTPTVVTKTDNNAVGLSSVTIPSLKDLTPGTATAGQILSGEKAWVNGTEITGTMPNNRALNKSDLAAGASFTIPAGYTTGGTVTAKSLASQTQASAGAGDILSGKTAYVNGNKITGTATAESHTVQSSKSVSPNFSSGNVTVSPDSPNNVMSSVVIQKDANLKPENIANGVTIFGVTGSLNSSSIVESVINNAEVVGTVRVAKNSDPTNDLGPKYITYDSNYFSYSSSNYSVTLQPGTYLLIACLAPNGAGSTYASLQFADMDISGSLGGANIKYKVVTITTPTTYTHSQTVSTTYAVGSCVCIRLN